MNKDLAEVRRLNAEKGLNNRKIGEAFEFRVLRKFKRRSDVLFAIRSAGSHSIIDIVVQFKNGKQYWINCKRNGYIEPREVRELEKLQFYKNGYARIFMYYYKSPKKMAYKEIK